MQSTTIQTVQPATSDSAKEADAVSSDEEDEGASYHSHYSSSGSTF